MSQQLNITKNQHTIPRMLLKRFASRIVQKRVDRTEYFVCCFRRDAVPFESNIRNCSAETYFYGKPANGVEGAFGTIESRHSTTLDSILGGTDPNACTFDLRELVWTLAVRTDNFRRNVRDLLVDGVGEMAQQAEGESVENFASSYINDEFDSLLDQAIESLPAVPARALRVSMKWRPELRDKFRHIANLFFEASDIARPFQTMLKEIVAQIDFDKLTDEAHIQSLETLILGECVPTTFRPEHWVLIRFPSKSVILGDGACFAIRNGRPGHLMKFGKDWDEIYLPISHDTVLVACRSEQLPRYGLEQINRSSVILSYNQFFTPEKASRYEILMPLIRTGEATLSPEELSDAVHGIWTRNTQSDESA